MQALQRVVVPAQSAQGRRIAGSFLAAQVFDRVRFALLRVVPVLDRLSMPFGGAVRVGAERIDVVRGRYAAKRFDAVPERCRRQAPCFRLRFLARLAGLREHPFRRVEFGGRFDRPLLRRIGFGLRRLDVRRQGREPLVFGTNALELGAVAELRECLLRVLDESVRVPDVLGGGGSLSAGRVHARCKSGHRGRCPDCGKGGTAVGCLSAIRVRPVDLPFGLVQCVDERGDLGAEVLQGGQPVLAGGDVRGGRVRQRVEIVLAERDAALPVEWSSCARCPMRR